MIKYIGILLLTLMLSGCNIFDTKPAASETVYVPFDPPSSLLVPCTPERPAEAEYGDLLVSFKSALTACDDKITTLDALIKSHNEKYQSTDEE